MPRHWTVHALGALVAMMIAPLAGRGVEYRNEKSHFRFVAPDNWVQIPDGKLAQIRANARMPANAAVHVAFEPANQVPDRDGSTFPLMFVQEILNVFPPMLTHDHIERLLNTEFRQGFEQGAGGQAKLGPILWDRDKVRFTAVSDMTAPNGLRIRWLMVGYLSRDSLIVLNYMSREREFEQQKPIFERSADSFQFDPGFRYEPFNMKRVALIAGSAVGGTCCCMIVMVVAIIGVCYLMARSSPAPKKKKKKKRRENYDDD